MKNLDLENPMSIQLAELKLKAGSLTDDMCSEDLFSKYTRDGRHKSERSAEYHETAREIKRLENILSGTLLPTT